MDFVGKDASLGVPDRNGIIRPTMLFEQIKQDAIAVRPKLVIVDTVADVFAGNENIRAQTRQFITLMRGLAIESGAAVILASHPSLGGIANDTGMSGSTAWHNGPRARGYFKAATEAEDDELRVLEWRKNNYGPISESIILRWRYGVYVPEPRITSIEMAAAERKAEDLFLTLLNRFNGQDRNVSDKNGTAYAPALFAKEAEAVAAKVQKDSLAAAMRRLFAADKLHMEQYGYASRNTFRIAAGPKP